MSHKTPTDIWRGRIRSLSHWYFYIRVSMFLQINYSCDSLIKCLHTDWQTRLIPGCRKGFFSSSPLSKIALSLMLVRRVLRAYHKEEKRPEYDACLPCPGVECVEIYHHSLLGLHGVLLRHRGIADCIHTQWNQGWVGCVLMFRQQNAEQNSQHKGS